MIRKISIYLIFYLAIVIVSCSKDDTGSSASTQSKQESLERSTGATQLSRSTGATQISGIGRFAAEGQCTDVTGFTFIVSMTGDLEGCLYTFVDDFTCTPSGTYREEGREYFVGTYNGQYGTFWTGYSFEGKYEGCPLNGEPLGAEIFGRCQHPIVDGSGTGVFEGVSGRLGFKDNVELLIFPYTGHLKF
jgi:hypothetical protein